MASNTNENNLDNATELDVVVVGAGFGGVWQLKRFRDEGYKVKILEAGTGYGGVWHWNAYPGARVDTPTPLYELGKPELWQSWSWKQRFPDHVELRAYFDYVAEKWDLRKDTHFNSFVESAVWSDEQAKWTVKTRQGDVFRAKFLSLNIGFAAKRHIPDWKGFDEFKGTIIHPSYWPHDGIDVKGKKVAVIGTGSTGVQIATELAPVASQLTVFQRSINTSLPMAQASFRDGKQNHPREDYPQLFQGRFECFTGFDFHFMGRKTFDDDAETRRQVYEDLWAHGDFHYWLATYHDLLFDEGANREAYNFWRDKTRARISDPRARDILAPMEQPYPFGCKRISLEQGFFEIFNEPHVDIVDVNATPIEEITAGGIKTSEREHDFDIIVSATGYDSCTGSYNQIDIRGRGGASLRDKWEPGVHTHLGMTVSGFPNMFMTYAPQGPTAFCNGPVCAQVQGDWIVSAVDRVQRSGLTVIMAGKEAEDEWRDTVMKIAYSSLLPKAKSWYMGDNIPGKTREPLIYLGGVDTYYKTLNKVVADDFPGFILE